MQNGINQSEVVSHERRVEVLAAGRCPGMERGQPAPAGLLIAPTFTDASPQQTDVGERSLAAHGTAILLPPGAAVKVSSSTPTNPDG